MTYPRYPDYKDSGVEWLGEVPEHWEVKKLKHVSSDIKAGPFGSSLTKDKYASSGYRVYGQEQVIAGDFSIGDYFISESDFVNFTEYEVHQNDILISCVGTFGKIALVPKEFERGIINPRLIRLRTDSSVFPEFIAKILGSNIAFEQLSCHSRGGTMDVINIGTLSQIAGAIPPRDEQPKILAFLDLETAKVDALVAEQERLIELLREKRQAVISHAVTKGLNPQAPLKDSGIEWLGAVPEHWSLLPLKRDLTFLTSGSRGWAEHYAEDGALFIRIGNLTRNSLHLDLSDIQRVAVPDGSEGERTRVVAGDLLFSITAYLGSVAVAPDELETSYVSQHVALARLQLKRFLPSWVGYATLSILGKTYLETQGYGGTKIQLSLDDIANLLLTAPPLPEQTAIVAYLDDQTAKIIALIAEAERAIELLKEHRSALISAAVTGKIDVRGLVAVEAETEAAL